MHEKKSTTYFRIDVKKNIFIARSGIFLTKLEEVRKVVLFYPDISKCKILHFEVYKFFCLKLPNSSRKSIKKFFTF